VDLEYTFSKSPNSLGQARWKLQTFSCLSSVDYTISVPELSTNQYAKNYGTEGDFVDSTVTC
jgi:hypothetical protein